jgi:replicative DNA helicase
MINRVPPHDTELEQLVLGAILLDSAAVGIVMPLITPERFYDGRMASIYERIVELYVENKPIDLLTVTQQARRKGLLDQCGGAGFIAQLTNRVASTANIEQWCAILNEHYMKREFARISAQVNEFAYDATADVFEIHDRFMSQMTSTFNTSVKTNISHIAELTGKVTEVVVARETCESGVTGLSSGIASVDKIIGGHQKSDLLYMAGRPSMGKTAMALTEMLNMALNKTPVALFSLEMSSTQIVLRLISMISGIDGGRLMKYRLTKEEMQSFYHYRDVINSLPIYIDDTAGLSVFDLRARVKHMVEKHKVEAVFIDYVQLMSSGVQLRRQGQNREQELSVISRNLKLIAKECDIAVIALSQLSRSVESRAEKRPMLSDLRESGSLEQDADVVVFLFRPEYYGIKRDEAGNDLTGIGEYIVAKQRNGSTGLAPMRFNANVMRYTDPSIKLTPSLPF